MLSVKRTLTYSVPSETPLLMKSTILPWTSGYTFQGCLRSFLIHLAHLAISLRSLAVMVATGLPPTHTTVGFFAMVVLPPVIFPGFGLRVSFGNSAGR